MIRMNKNIFSFWKFLFRTNILLLLILVTAITFPVQSSASYDINTILMKSTFKISGKGSTGTAFIMGKPDSGSKKYDHILITANHVLSDMRGTTAIVHLRKKIGGKYIKIDYEMPIRKKKTELWMKHPKMDVAVIKFNLPSFLNFSLASTELLASDTIFRKFEIHPGDDLNCLGYPYLQEANPAGFPILRSGKIASYPIVPTRRYKSILYDFEVFKGNSGGPVYFSESGRNYDGGLHPGKIQFVAGLVSAEEVVEEEIESLTEIVTKKHKLSLAYVVPGPFIRETINMLPQK